MLRRPLIDLIPENRQDVMADAVARVIISEVGAVRAESLPLRFQKGLDLLS